MLVLVCLAVVDVIYKDVQKDLKPDRLNAAFKTRPLELYEAETLLSVAVEIAGGDDEVGAAHPLLLLRLISMAVPLVHV